MHNKSQAALEFLTTYAWAFLVIIIMVGALAYFGVLSPSKLLPDRCNFGAEIGCNKDFLVVNNVNTGTVTMRVENNVGSPITITDIIPTTNIDTSIIGTCEGFITNAAGTKTDPDVTNVPWGSDEGRTLTVDCGTATNLVEDEKIKFGIEIRYFPTAAGITYTKNVFGEVFTTIQ